MVKIRKNFRRWRDRAEHSRSQKELEDQRLIAAIDDGGDDSEKIRRFVLPDSVVMSAPQGLARAGKPGRQRRMVVVIKINFLVGCWRFEKEAKRLAAQEAVSYSTSNPPIRFNSDGVAILENEEKKHEMIEQAGNF
ncbi:unnamed protein product, partial [Mesorhabditis belari]|uniref:Uncharacterized protein n=1 Tax=Mesorhabditis belari TaxID=2138241 RepID=A0AAF3FC21_9BILA